MARFGPQVREAMRQTFATTAYTTTVNKVAEAEDKSVRAYVTGVFFMSLAFRLILAFILVMGAYFAIKQVAGTTSDEVEVACANNGGTMTTMPGVDDYTSCQFPKESK